MGIEENKAIVKKFLAATGVGDLETCRATMWEDATWWNGKHLKISGVFTREPFFELVADIFKTAAGPLSLEFGLITAEDDRVSVQGESHGDLLNGLHYNNNYHWLFVLRDGKISQVYEYMNDQEFLRCFPEFTVDLGTIPKEGQLTDFGSHRALPTGKHASNKAVAMRFMTALGAGETQVAKDLWHQDGTWNMPKLLKTEGIYGRDKFIQLAASTFEAADEPVLVKMEFFTATAEDDRVCLQARSCGEFPGGIRYSNDYNYLITMKDGKVLHGWEYLSSLEYIRCFPGVEVDLDEYRQVKKTA